jgi:multidrug resistance protein, MATE family
LPIIFLEVSETLLQATDTAFLARVGNTEVAALALADTILQFWTVVIVGLVAALLIVIARRLGEGNERAAGQTFNLVLLLVVLISLFLTATLKAGSPLLLDYVVASQEVGRAVDAYLQIGAYGIVFQSISLAYTALYIGLRRTRVLVGAGSVLVVTNFVLSYVLIFGKLGLPPMGIEGAALGELGAEIATFVFLTAFTLRRLDLGRYGLFRLDVWDGKLAWSMFRTSSPVALQELLEGVRWFLFFVIIERVSTEALAWSNIIYACYTVLLIPTMAFGETTISMVSDFIGRGRTHRTGRLIRVDRRRTHNIGRLIGLLSSSAYLMTLPVMVMGLLFPSMVLSIFTSDQAAIEGAAGGLRVVLLSMLIGIPAEMWFAAVLGTGDTDAVLLIEFFLTAATLVVVYVAAFVIVPVTLSYLWISLPVAWLIGLVLSYGWVKAGYWERREV